MAIAVLAVSLLVLFMLGWRESVVVAIAIPSTLSLTLLVFYLLGYTLNRITLFALIFSIGILVDDAIVVVENIDRHRDLEGGQRRSLRDIAVRAVAEVGNPTILATLTVIAAIVPMGFVGGLMGPYMRPIPIGCLGGDGLLAADRLRGDALGSGAPAPLARRGGSTPGCPFRAVHPRLPLADVPAGGPPDVALVVPGPDRPAPPGSDGLRPAGWTRVKMLPHDNKSELEIVLNMPEESSLERTAQAAREIAAAVRQEKEVTDYQVYVGTAAPYSFNGLVRHYYLRQGSSVAEIQVNLLPKDQRSAQSHPIALRIRPAVAAVAARYGARVAVAEVPPGPPVLQSLVAEVYGPSGAARQRLAERMRAIFTSTPGVVDVDWYVESPHPKELLVVDKEKAALHGITADVIARTLRVAVGGELGRSAASTEREQEDVEIVVDVPRTQRSNLTELLAIRLPDGRGQAMVPLGELVRVESTIEDRSIYHKNLLSVVYVTGDVAGGAESPAYSILQMNKAVAALPGPVAIHNSVQPASDARPAIKWDGEWQITLEVFRDLGERLRHRPDPHLRPAGGVVPFPADAAGGHGGDSLLAGGDPPGARGAGRVFHRHLDDWLHGRCGHRCAKLDHPGRLRRGPDPSGNAGDGSSGGGRGSPLPAHAPHRDGSGGGRRGDPLRPNLPGPGHLPGRGRGGLPADQPDGGPGSLRHGLRRAGAKLGQRRVRCSFRKPPGPPRSGRLGARGSPCERKRRAPAAARWPSTRPRPGRQAVRMAPKMVTVMARVMTIRYARTSPAVLSTVAVHPCW